MLNELEKLFVIMLKWLWQNTHSETSIWFLWMLEKVLSGFPTEMAQLRNLAISIYSMYCVKPILHANWKEKLSPDYDVLFICQMYIHYSISSNILLLINLKLSLKCKFTSSFKYTIKAMLVKVSVIDMDLFYRLDRLCGFTLFLLFKFCP